ncbi:MAG TPA: siderophore-interacting protein [Geodermatophilus sp.]|nr:siderophore-interacting protein [Geodermatophilus sp.]
MRTSSPALAAAPVQEPAAPEWRFFRAAVAGVRRLGPHAVRLTLAGEDLAGFGVGGDDQRIKLVLARDADSTGDGLERLLHAAGHWYAAYCDLPDDRRPHLRTYTVRAARPERAELDVDVVLHGLDDGHAGPASRWAARAEPGDPVVLLGPDRPGRGQAWGCEWAPPPTARTLLLAGDETAVPAVGAILEALAPGPRVTALLEVPTPADVQEIALPAGVSLRWLPRNGRAHGELLVPAVHAALCELGIASATPGRDPEDVDVDGAVLWDVPAGDPTAGCYAWLAGEAGMVTLLRRRLVRDLGVPRGAVAFMGYWRRGVAHA